MCVCVCVCVCVFVCRDANAAKSFFHLFFVFYRREHLGGESGRRSLSRIFPPPVYIYTHNCISSNVCVCVCVCEVCLVCVAWSLVCVCCVLVRALREVIIMTLQVQCL